MLHDPNGFNTIKINCILVIVLVLQLTLYFATFYDIPVARQALSFVYLTFIPGFVGLKLLGINRLSTMENIIFSIGLSLVTLMLIGLIMNELLPLFGISQPLALSPLVAATSSFVLIRARRIEHWRFFSITSHYCSIRLLRIAY